MTMNTKPNRLSPALKGAALSLLIGLSAVQPLHARPSQLPLSITYAVEPNVMILFDTSGSMGSRMNDANGNRTTRIQIGKDAITDLISSIEGVRFGLASFHNNTVTSRFGSRAEGASLSATSLLSSDDAALSDMVTTINGLRATGYTPLQEAYYDLTRYYRNMPPYFGSFPSSYADPVNYRCQSNSIIVVTDGLPTRDWDHRHLTSCSGSLSNFASVDTKCNQTPINLADDPDANWGGTSGPSLPDWDNKNGIYLTGSNQGSTIIRSDRPYPPYSDGFCDGKVYSNDTSYNCRTRNRNDTSYNLYLDDFAKFATDIDLKTSGTDATGKSYQDPDFVQQNISTHTIGFNVDAQVLRDAASDGYGNGTYKSASSASGLKTALESAILTAVGGQGVGAGATQASISLDDNGETNVYVTKYDSEQWSGDLIKVVVNEDTDGDLEATIEWKAAAVLNGQTIATRNIFSHDGSTTSPTFNFTYANLSRLSGGGNYGNDTTGINDGKTLAQLTIEYLRGHQTHEKTATDESDQLFRSRVSPLGDLIRSRPTFVRNQDFGYTDADYADYIRDHAEGKSGARDATIYVGGNDGMLHAFKEEDGSETFAFIPKTIQSSLPDLAAGTYNSNHQFFVDGDMSIVDVRDSSDVWKTVLASPLGGGFKGLFMLDVTDPNASHANLFKWEINEETTNIVGSSNVRVFSKMGYMLNNPKIVRFQIPEGSGNGFHEKWVVIAGNGVHSEDAADNNVIGKASIFIIDMETGELISEILLDNGYVNQSTASNATPAYSKLSRGNGVTSVAAVDVSTNSFIDRLYAADLKGQLWRIDYDYDQSDNVTNDNQYLKNNLTVAFNPGNTPSPIFTATGPVRTNPSDTSPSGSEPQAITGEITVTKAPQVADSRVGEMVFFGTGQYFDFHHILNKDNLKVQSFYAIWDKGNWDAQTEKISKADDLIEQTISEAGDKRTLSNATIDYAGTDLGWYVDLPTYGERIVRKPIGIFSHISFFSQIPKDPDVCIEGSNAWAMIARRDTATPLINAGTTLPAGTKHTGLIQDPIFVETKAGRLIAPAFIFTEDGSNNSSVSIDNIIDIQKNYSRSSWKRLQF